MIYTPILAATWTKVVDSTVDDVILQVQRPSGIQVSFGQPAAGESGFLLGKNDILNLVGGTYGTDIWVFCNHANTVIVQNGQGSGSGQTITSGWNYTTISDEVGCTVSGGLNAPYHQVSRVGDKVQLTTFVELTIADATEAKFTMTVPFVKEEGAKNSDLGVGVFHGIGNDPARIVVSPSGALGVGDVNTATVFIWGASLTTQRITLVWDYMISFDNEI